MAEATGSGAGVRSALALTRPLGTIVLKSTVSAAGTSGDAAPSWSKIANDLVVQEKRLVGSRCGPFDAALEMAARPAVRALLGRMVAATYPLSEGLAALEHAARRGVLKIQLICSHLEPAAGE